MKKKLFVPEYVIYNGFSSFELDGHFDNNFFDLLPNRKYILSRKPGKDKKTTLKDFSDNFNNLSVNSVIFE